MLGQTNKLNIAAILMYVYGVLGMLVDKHQMKLEVPMNQRMWKRGRMAAIRHVMKFFDDADVDVQVICECEQHQRYRLVAVLDFGQTENAIGSEWIDIAEMTGPNRKEYTRGLLNTIVRQLQILTGRE